MDMIDVVMRLNGPIEPRGDSRIDAERLENLKALCDLTGRLLERIQSVADAYGDHMASIKAAKDYAAAFLASTPASAAPALWAKQYDDGTWAACLGDVVVTAPAYPTAEAALAAAGAAPAAPFAKGSWQHAVDDQLVGFGRTSQEFASPHDAVKWLLQQTVEAAPAEEGRDA